MADFFSINRNALIVRPRQALLDWVNSIFPEDPVTLDELGTHDSADIFLIPDFDSVEDALEWVQESHEAFLRYSLEDWCTDERLWPKPLDWDLFQRFHDFSIQMMVIDSVGPEYDEDFEDQWDDAFEEEEED